jgi:hypothetical protein
MERRGISQKVAMDLMGHKTPSMYQRYNIVDTKDLHAGAARLDGLLPVQVKPRVKLAAVVGSGPRRNR